MALPMVPPSNGRWALSILHPVDGLATFAHIGNSPYLSNNSHYTCSDVFPPCLYETMRVHGTPEFLVLPHPFTWVHFSTVFYTLSLFYSSNIVCVCVGGNMGGIRINADNYSSTSQSTILGNFGMDHGLDLQ